MKLYIAEKPSLGRTVANILGKSKSVDGGLSGENWMVTWCFGHMFETLKPEDYTIEWANWRMDALPMVPTEWKLAPREDAKRQISLISGMLQKADSVVNVGDPDREGQLLVDELLLECNWTGQTERLWLPDLTDKGIKKALDTMSSNDEYRGLYDSAIARQRADWLVGMNLTRAYTINARYSGHDGVLSVGRVQTPTLSLVVDRDNAIENFVSIAFYEIEGKFAHENGEYVGKLKLDESITDPEGRLIDQTKANELVETARQQSQGTISDLNKTRKTNHPPLCFSLTDLQALASKRFGISVDKVLEIAQSLYETHKMTTYPRSESGFLSENQLEDVPSIVNSLTADSSLTSIIAGIDLSLKSKTWNNAKSSKEAHTAIIPTGDCSRLSNLNELELGVFRLIAERYLIQFYPPNIIEQTTFNTQLGAFVFNSNGNVTIEQGWKAIFNDTEDKEGDKNKLIEVRDQDNVKLNSVHSITKNTTPPKPFTESTLVIAMKNIAKYISEQGDKETLRDISGIGTVATRGKIIENLKKRGFLANKGNSILSTDQAKKFIALLPDDIKSAVTTAQWEQRLTKIVSGELTVEEFTRAQIDYVQSAISNVGKIRITPDENAIQCPECGEGVLQKRSGKYGTFWGCNRYADGCKTTFKDNKGKPILENKKPTQSFPEQECPHDDCTGTVRQFNKRNGKGKLWVCGDCEKAGRNKFFNDAKGVPVVQIALNTRNTNKPANHINT